MIRSLVACFYLLFAFWISSHSSELKMFFYPTLGAFCYFFMSRNLDNKNVIKIIIMAFVAAMASSILHYFNPGMITLFITCLLTLFMINFFKLNAAPIVAVALIPYFSNTSSIWLLPLSVLCSLIGLLITLQITYYLEAKWEVLKGRLSFIKSDESIEKELTM